MCRKGSHTLTHQSAFAINLLGTSVLTHIVGVIDIDRPDNLLAGLDAVRRFDTEVDIDLAVLGGAVGLPGVDHDVAGLGGLHQASTDGVVLPGSETGTVSLDLDGSAALCLNRVASVALVGEGNIVQGAFGVVRVDRGFNNV